VPSPAAAGRPFTAAVSEAGALSRRPRGAQQRSSLTGMPKPEPAATSLRPRNALLGVFLTQHDATELEGSVIGTVAYCGFALANAGHDPRRCKPISAIAIFSPRCAILSWRQWHWQQFDDTAPVRA
jgi:hypothetical protein